MDLFDQLVQLDLAGWRTSPPIQGESTGAPELDRLLRKCSALERDGERYTFTGVDASAPAQLECEARCLRDGETSTWLLLHGPVLEHGPEGWVVLAQSLPGFLQQLIEPVAYGQSPAQPLGELAFDGSGWGWALDEVSAPSLLTELPEELADTPLHIDLHCIWAGERIRDLPEAPPDVDDAEQDAADPQLDELFGGGVGRPQPRTGLVALLLLVGVLTTVLGMACIAAPGGILVLIAWTIVEKDHDRVESGYLPEADRARVERSRSLTHAGLLLVIALFLLQAVLLCFGAYDSLLDQVYIPMWRSFVTGLLGGTPIDTDLP